MLEREIVAKAVERKERNLSPNEPEWCELAAIYESHFHSSEGER